MTRAMEGDALARALVSIATPSLRTLVSAGTRVTVTDVGAADGILLRRLMNLWPDDLRAATEWRGIDIRARPPGLDSSIAWIVGDIQEIGARLPAAPGLVVAHELLDDIPCDIVEPDDDGNLHVILVEPSTGMQSVGPLLGDAAGCSALGVDGVALAAWCANWWSRREPTARIEVGIARDATWRCISSLVTDGMAIAIDYAHVRDERMAGRWDGGTLAAYAAGRPVRAVPDGTCNITAHVAIDSCRAASPSAHSILIPPRADDDFWWLVQSTLPLT